MGHRPVPALETALAAQPACPVQPVFRGSGLTGERGGLVTIGGSSSVSNNVDDRSGVGLVASFWHARPVGGK